VLELNGKPHQLAHYRYRRYGTRKMASAGEDAVEDALNVLVSVTEKSGNLRNNIKDILKAVSSLRKDFAKLRREVEDKNKLIFDLEMKAVETNITLKALRSVMDSRGD
jgi:chromosome segregation ATPase